MDDGLKQRLVGAVVLIAVAVLFLPSLFERGAERTLDLTSQIPAEPVVIPQPLVVPEPEPPADIAPAKPLDSPPEIELPESAETLPPQSADVAVTTADAWSIQVGSFAEAERAAALVERLLAEGHRAYSRSAKANGRAVHRVYVGPKLDRNQAEKAKQALDDLLKADTLIVRFEP